MPRPRSRKRPAKTAAALTLFSLLAACPAVDEAIDRGGANNPPVNPVDPPDPAEPADSAGSAEASGEAPGKEVIQPPAEPEPTPPESKRLADVPSVPTIRDRSGAYFEGTPGRRIHVQVDKPLYKPGETIWIKTWDLRARDLAGPAPTWSIRYELVSPKGAVVLQKLVQEQRGLATNDFEIPEGVQGGEYIIRAISQDGHQGERPVVVSTYEPPRLKKKLEFVRKAYGVGDEVSATIQIQRPTGEPLAKHPLTGAIWLDGETLTPVKVTTNADGGALVKFKLPARIERGDGLLTVLVEDGGVTESVSKRIPIILKKLDFAFFPEGGQLVAGIPGRVYFEAKNTIGKPADVEGKIVDDRGNAVATFSTHHAGLGRIEFSPATARKYHAEITRPVGITEHYALPIPAEQGCALRSFDDLDGGRPEIRVAVRCSETKKVVVAAIQRHNFLDAAAVEVKEGEPAVVYLKAATPQLQKLQGVARVTVFDEALNPLAERLVYRNRRRGLRVEITPDRAQYSPRDQVSLAIRATDDDNAGVAADLAVSVVDDTVVSFADDKTGHMLSRLFLEPEIADKVEEPNFFFDLTKAKSALAMDLLMGTRGYRRFEWQTVLTPPPPPMPVASSEMEEAVPMAAAGMREEGRARGVPAMPPAAPQRRAVPAAPPPPAPPALGKGMAAPKEPPAKAEVAMNKVAAAPPAPARERAQMGRRMAGPRQDLALDDMAGAPLPQDAAPEMADKDWAGEKKKARVAMAFAPVRVFPAPTYKGPVTGPRTDFRETIHWAPNVTTNAQGKATVSFYLSDSVTSFRVFAEGVGGGLAGRAEKVVKSSLPFSMSVKLPVEVSAGDRFLLPLTLTNDRDQGAEVALESSLGEHLVLEDEKGAETDGQAIITSEPKLKTTLASGERKSVFYPVTVRGTQGKSKISVAADASGLRDEFTRELTVVPVGFPQVRSVSGTLKDRFTTSVDLGDALQGSTTATIKLYPSPVSTLLGGLDGMLREPNGCFEQTSSTNYPNIMVMQYMRANDIADPDLLERASQLLDRGYKRLAGFETPNKGYEWFGQAPGHEALTAYGLLEFVDFRAVYGGVDDEMVKRTSQWIKSRRDGRGGFARDPKALDSFGGAKPEVTDAYIVYSLTEAGFKDIDQEVARQAELAEKTADPYLLALATNTLLNVPARKSEAARAVKKLAAMQKEDGGFVGQDHSITRSTGPNLHIETTSLALLALMKAGGEDARVRRGVEWLYKSRGGFGAWNATQATVLALKALTRYSIDARKTQGSGEIKLMINGKSVASAKYEAGRKDAIELTDLGRHFQNGKNELALVHDGQGELPFSIAVEFRALKPATDPDVVVDLSTKLERNKLRMGENVRLTATIKNKTAAGQPMTIARIGLPSGLSFQTWQLKELKEKGVVAFTETRAREVIVYFRDLKPNEEKVVPLDLVALIPGQFTGPASSAYLYYTDNAKVWVDGLPVTVTR